MTERITLGRFLGVIVLVGATLRMTRFVTSDWLGHWWIVRPARTWALSAEPAFGDDLLKGRMDVDELWNDIAADEVVHYGWRVKLVKGLDCPFCVGFWIGVAVLLGDLIFTRVPGFRQMWRLALGALALNYLTGHVSSRAD